MESGPLSDAAEAGVLIDEADSRASDGKLAVVGVLRDGSFGLVAAIVSVCVCVSFDASDIYVTAGPGDM